MFHVAFAYIIHAERERELDKAIRRRQLLEPQDETVEPGGARDRRASDARTLTARVRPTGG
jgi:hypothetical protein